MVSEAESSESEYRNLSKREVLQLFLAIYLLDRKTSALSNFYLKMIVQFGSFSQRFILLQQAHIVVWMTKDAKDIQDRLEPWNELEHLNSILFHNIDRVFIQWVVFAIGYKFDKCST